MAKRSNVPKFGSWDGDYVPYTAFFENARKGKSNGVIMNPNDPEQNPEAFYFGVSSDGINNEPTPVASRKSASIEKNTNQANTHNQKKSSFHHKNALSESSNDKRLSSYSISSVKPNDQNERSEKNEYMPLTNISPSEGPSHKLNYADEYCSESVSVPKFGEWDDKDPRSGEGFTAIFNRVREEKDMSSSEFRPMTPQHINNLETSQQKKTRSKKFRGFKTWMGCC